MLLLDNVTRFFDEAVVLHARGAGGDACEAPEAAVEMSDHRRAQGQRPVELRLHQLDPPAWRVHLLLVQHVGGTAREAEAAMDAVAGESV